MQEDNSYCILNNLGNAIFDTEDQLRHLAVSKKKKKVKFELPEEKSQCT